LCDGKNGTPNLLDRFVVGAGKIYAVGATGGSTQHSHVVHVGRAGMAFSNSAQERLVRTGNYQSSTSNHLPPYYACAYIMKL